jgi:transposase
MPESWTLLPAPHQIHVTCLIPTTSAILAHAEAIAATAVCPRCGHLSSHIHSRYTRTVADLPWHSVPFQIRLRVRKFFCDEPSCDQRVFTERLPGVVAPSARRTVRLTAWMAAIGFALGGAAGTRLLRALDLVKTRPTPRPLASSTTLVRLIRATPVPVDPVGAKPQVVGVDDWCFLRGHRYGAMVVDLERRQILDLLPDRDAETLATWLQAHPGITVVSRDRGGSFADGAARGAPQAQQVADRFHLLKNLMEAFQRVLGREQAALRTAAEVVTQTGTVSATRPLTAPERQARATAQERRQARYDAVHRLRAEGKTTLEIAVELRMGHNTIQRLLRAATCPTRAQRHAQATLLSTYEPYLRDRWNSGEQNGQTLLCELRAQGYRGSQATLYGFLGRWRTGARHRGPYGPYAPQPALTTPIPPPLRTSPRAVSWRLLRPETDLSATEQAYVETLLQQNATIATMTTAVISFFALVRERRAEELDAWVAQAKASGIPELAGFAEGIRRDEEAVRAACTSPWSQGQVEGQVNRLKLLKRQMYGRANLDLLRRRVLGLPSDTSVSA